MGSIHSMPICSHINFYSLTLKVHFDLLWPLWPLFGLNDNFFQLLNIHFNISNRGASSEVTIILVISLNKFRFLGPKNGRLLNRERIVWHKWHNSVKTWLTNKNDVLQYFIDVLHAVSNTRNPDTRNCTVIGRPSGSLHSKWISQYLPSFHNRNGWNLVSRHIFWRCLDT